VRLIPLHSGSEQALCEALGLPRVGMLGLRAEADCWDVWEHVADVDLVQVPMLKEVRTGQWMGTKIEMGSGKDG
jgi:hypothetical protein